MYKYTILLKSGVKIEAVGEMCESVYKRKILSAPLLLGENRAYDTRDIAEISVEKIEES